MGPNPGMLINRRAATQAFLAVGALPEVPERAHLEPHFPLDQPDDVMKVCSAIQRPIVNENIGPFLPIEADCFVSRWSHVGLAAR